MVADAIAAIGARKRGVAEGGGADDDAGVDPGLEVIGMIGGDEFGELVGSVIEDDLVIAAHLSGGGDGAGFGEEGLIEISDERLSHDGIKGDAENGQNQCGSGGGIK